MQRSPTTPACLFPTPVQILRTEVLLEFIGDADGTGALRLAETRPEPDKLASLWSQLVEAMTTLASVGLARGDLFPPTICSSITSGW